jgi:hypothetical protein
VAGSSSGPSRPDQFRFAALERASIARLLAGGQQPAYVLIMTRPGQASEVGQKLRQALGILLTLDADTDFINTRVPTALLDDLTRWPELTALQISIGRDRTVLHNRTEDGPSSEESSVTESPLLRECRQCPARLAIIRTLGSPRPSRSSSVCASHLRRPRCRYRWVRWRRAQPVDAIAHLGMSLEGARLPRLVEYWMIPPSPDLIGSPIPEGARKWAYGGNTLRWSSRTLHIRSRSITPSICCRRNWIATNCA